MQSNNFVTTDWLAARLGEPGLTIMDGSFFLPTQNRNARSEYLAGHIPTAVFFDIDEIADRSTSLPHMLPGEKQGTTPRFAGRTKLTAPAMPTRATINLHVRSLA